MTSLRGLGAGLCLLLILTGCSEEDGGEIKDGGVYSPIIAGIDANNEPAIRGEVNQFTVLVTNVNGYPLTYHWSAAAGVLTDSTNATANWTAPDSIGVFPLTVSIQSQDPAFFQSTTFQIFTDNQFVRWTNSPEVQFDPAPIPSGGVLFAQITNNTTGAADIYSTTNLALSPVQLVTGFGTLASPTMRSDEQQISFAAKRLSSDAGPSIWLLPAAGGDPSTALPAQPRTPGQTMLANPRFARTGNWLLYNSDSTRPFTPRPWFLNANNPGVPQTVIEISAFLAGAAFWMPAWGPDTDGNGLPDSVVCNSYRFFGNTNQQSRGLFKLPTTPEQNSAPQWLADSSAAEADWSANGQHIVYAKRSPTGDRDIWIINAASMDPNSALRVTSGPADDSHPRFSNDGTTIYFVSNRVDNYGLNGIYNTERRGTNIWSVARFDLP